MTAKPILFALRYPRSFFGLLIAAFLLVALPLVGALLSSAWHSERLAEQGRFSDLKSSGGALHKLMNAG